MPRNFVSGYPRARDCIYTQRFIVHLAAVIATVHSFPRLHTHLQCARMRRSRRTKQCNKEEDSTRSGRETRPKATACSCTVHVNQWHRAVSWPIKCVSNAFCCGRPAYKKTNDVCFPLLSIVVVSKMRPLHPCTLTKQKTTIYKNASAMCGVVKASSAVSRQASSATLKHASSAKSSRTSGAASDVSVLPPLATCSCKLRLATLELFSSCRKRPQDGGQCDGFAKSSARCCGIVATGLS